MTEREAQMTKNAAWIMAKKEVKLLFKSKRRIMLLSTTPLIILLIGIIGVTVGSTIDNTVDPTTISIIDDSDGVYSQQLQSLYSSINDTEFELVDDSYQDLVEGKNFNVIVYFPSNFSTLIENSEPAPIVISYNDNSSRNQNIALQIFQLTSLYEQQLILTDNPDIEFDRVQTSLNTIETSEEEGGISQELASSIFIIPVYIIFFVVIPPISLIMISVTIEREQKTLETLFLQPVPRSSIMSGKILYGIAIIGMVIVLDIIAIGIDVLLIRLFLLSDSDGEFEEIFDLLTDLLGFDIIFFFLITTVLISVLVVGLSVLLSLIAKDEREANLISGILPLLLISIVFLVQAVDLTELSFVAQVTFSVVPLLGIMVALYLALVAGNLGLISFVSIGAQMFWLWLTISFAARLSESESILEMTAQKVLEEVKNAILRR